ncbi:hypothetical protein D3C72_1716860 [compost metagenome]
MLIRKITLQLVQASLACIQNPAGLHVWIDGFVHPREHTIGTGEQLLHFWAELLVLHCYIKLGRVELEGAVLCSIDAQLTQRGQTVAATQCGQLITQVAEDRTRSRIPRERTQQLIAVFVLGHCS